LEFDTVHVFVYQSLVIFFYTAKYVKLKIAFNFKCVIVAEITVSKLSHSSTQ